MNINQMATAGTLESGDIMVTVEPAAASGIRIELSSVVEKQFGEHIRKVIHETAEKNGVNNIAIFANDRGALDCVIVSRVATAICRAAGAVQQQWEAKR